MLGCVMLAGSLPAGAAPATGTEPLVLTLTTEAGVEKRISLRGRAFSGDILKVTPLAEAPPGAGALAGGGAFHDWMQDPLKALFLSTRLLRSGAVDDYMAQLVDLQNPEADAEAVAAFSGQPMRESIRRLGAGATAVEPLLLIERAPDRVEIYYWLSGTEGDTPYRLLSAATFKDGPQGWKILPRTLSQEKTPEVMAFKEALAQERLRIEPAAKSLPAQ